MAFSRGEPFSHKVGNRILAPTSTTTTLAAIPPEARPNGAFCVVTTGPRLFVFAAASTATASAGVIAPASGSGRWLELSGGSVSDWKESVHLATITALPANTRTGNVLLANAVGALGNIDGVLAVAGKRYLIQNEGGGASHANNGIYVLDDAGGATKFQFTRATDADESAKVTADMTVPVELGTVFGGKARQLKTTAAINLNTTALEFGPFETTSAYHVPVADAAALAAIPAVDRADGMSVVKVDDDTIWTFDSASAAGATDWCVAPLAGAGRWLRKDQLTAATHAPVADAAALVAITATGRGDGMTLVKLDDMTCWAYDLSSIATTTDFTIEPTDGVGCWMRKDAPAGLILPPVANNAGLVALTAVQRVDGSVVVQLDTMTTWVYDLGSVAGATDWCVAPTDGVGRWIRYDDLTGALHAPVADAAAVAAIPAAGRVNAMALVKTDDMTPWGFSATSVAPASNSVIAPAAGAGMWHRGYIFSGCPAQNRLRMLGAPGIIATGDTITIGADVYEIRPDTPPTGGNAARIWVYTGADSHAARVNLCDAINGVVDAARIANQVATEHFLAEHDHVTVGDVTIVSADDVGGTPIPSATATACAEGLTTPADIWDNATCRFGALAGALQHSRAVVTILASDIAKGAFQLHFDFTPYGYQIRNRTTAANMEAIAIVGDSISITLTGGAPPAIQANDVLDIFVTA